MFREFKNRLAQRKIAHLQKSHNPKSIKKLRTIGVILDLDLFENLSEAKMAIQQLNPKGIAGKVIVFSTTRKSTDAFEGLSFRKNQVNSKGIKPGSHAEEFQENGFDLLLNYFVEAPPQLLVLSAAVKANLKVGFPGGQNTINDLTIDVLPKNSNQFFSEIKKYIPLLNQNL